MCLILGFFYAYSYAFGLLISKYLQSEVKRDRSFVSKIEDFLSPGLSESSLDIFLKLGIDIRDKEFWDRGLDSFEKMLDETEKLAKKLGKLT